jgi:hypothetical protein
MRYLIDTNISMRKTPRELIKWKKEKMALGRFLRSFEKFLRIGGKL